MTWDGTYAPGTFGPEGAPLLIRNLRGVVSGRLGESLIEADSILVERGRISRIGADGASAAIDLDAQGAVAIPGLI
ncbi:MAG TPA: hypothetical protein VFB90_05660, partial [Dehalococcoidia bacterium]|nr:hypothetical protein [Dehalococcoidia bacterium]